MSLASSPAPPEPGTTPSGAARTAFGLGALVIGAAAVTLGVLAASWYLVIGLSVVALVLGLVGMGRFRGGGAAAGGLSLAGTVLAIMALIVGVWSSAVFLHVGNQNNTLLPAANAVVTTLPAAPATTASDVPTVAGPQTPFDQTETVDSVAISLSRASAYTPTAQANTRDGSPIQRAVKFTVTMVNNSDEAVNAVGIQVTGVANGQTAQLIYDSGITAPQDDLPPGESVTFPIALSVPAGQAQLVVIITPEAQSSSDQANFVGTV
jgi:hypothetical protein